VRWIRPFRWMCLSVGLTLGVLGGTGIGLHAASADTAAKVGRPFAFAGLASAAAVQQQLDTTHGLEAIPQAVYSRLPDGLSRFSSVGSTARASVFYPGGLVANLPTLVCEAGGPCSGTPTYPYIAQANDGKPDGAVTATTPVGDIGAPLGFGAGTASAHVTADGVKSDASITGFDLGGAAAGGLLVHVATIESHTSQTFQNTTTLVVHAESRLSGIDLLGGVIHIGSIFTTSTSTGDGQKIKTHADDVTVHDVTVAGVPASIGANGITLGPTNTGPLLGSVNALLDQTLSTLGASVRLLGKTPADQGMFDPAYCSDGEVTGLLLHAHFDLSNVPPSLFPSIPGLGRLFGPDDYFTNIILGGSCASASASPDRNTGDNGSLGPPVAAAAGTTGGSGAAAGTAGTPAVAGTPGVPTLANQPSSAAAPSRGKGRPAPTNLLEDALVANRVELLYLAFTLLFLGVFLGMRPLVPARFGPTG
jgi:hypothetical protein